MQPETASLRQSSPFNWLVSSTEPVEGCRNSVDGDAAAIVGGGDGEGTRALRLCESADFEARRRVPGSGQHKALINLFNRNNLGAHYVTNIATLSVPAGDAASGNVTDVCTNAALHRFCADHQPGPAPPGRRGARRLVRSRHDGGTRCASDRLGGFPLWQGAPSFAPPLGKGGRPSQRAPNLCETRLNTRANDFT